MLIEEIREGNREYYAGIICKQHNYREIAEYAYQLDNLECPACIVAEERERQERENWLEMRARRGHPSTCPCRSCAPWEDEYDRMQAEEAKRLHIADIESSNYCSGYRTLDLDPPF